VSKRTQKIGKVVSLAASEERHHGDQTGRSQRSLNEQLATLGELHAYRQNYSNKAFANNGVSASHWQDYQSFLQRLDRAVQSQQQIVHDGEQQLEAHRKRWMVKRQKLESLQRVLSRCREQDRSFEERLEQKRLDDIPCAGNNTFKSDAS
jgi:flagellar FliJ protein